MPRKGANHTLRENLVDQRCLCPSTRKRRIKLCPIDGVQSRRPVRNGGRAWAWRMAENAGRFGVSLTAVARIPLRKSAACAPETESSALFARRAMLRVM